MNLSIPELQTSQVNRRSNRMQSQKKPRRHYSTASKVFAPPSSKSSGCSSERHIAAEKPSFAHGLVAVLLALIPPTSGTLRGLIVPGLKLSDIILIFVACILLLRWGGKWKVMDGVGVAFLLFAVISVVLTMVNYLERPALNSDVPLIMEVVSIPQFLLLYLIAFAFGQQREGSARVLHWNLVFAAIVSVIAMAQLLDLGPTRAVLAVVTGNPEIVDPFEWKTYRASGTFASWHALGMYLAITLSFSVAFLFKVPLSRTKRTQTWVLSGLVFCGLLSALTATPILLVAAVIIFYGLRTKGILYTPVFVLIGVLLVFTTPIGSLFSERIEAQQTNTGADLSWLPQTISYRVTIWTNDYLPIISKNLVSGYGPLDSSDSGVFEFTESMYITILMAGGIPLLVMYSVFMLVGFVKLQKISKTLKASNASPSLRAMSSVMALVIVFLAGAQLLHPYLIDAGGSQVVYMALGLILGDRHQNIAKSENVPEYARPGARLAGTLASA